MGVKLQRPGGRSTVKWVQTDRNYYRFNTEKGGLGGAGGLFG
jgi:hypothetical protein